MLNRISAGPQIVVSTGSANLADGVLRVVLPLIAVASGASVFEVSVLVATAMTPWLVGGIFAGTIVDAHRRSTVVRSANAARFVLLAALAALVAADIDSFSAIVVVAFCCGICEVFSDLGSQSAVSLLVPDDGLERTYGRVSAVQTAGNQLVGPAIAGSLVVLSPALVLAGAALSYLLAAATMPRTRTVAPAELVREPYRRRLLAGVQAIRTNSWLARTTVAVGAMNFASGASLATLVTYAVAPGPLMLTSAQYGLLLACAGLGAIAGGVFAPKLSSALGGPRSLVVGFAAMMTSVAAPSLLTNVIGIGALLFLGSALGMMFGMRVIAARQRAVEPHLQGRVNAAFQVVGLGSTPLGALAGGAVAANVDQRIVFALFAAAAAAVVVLVGPWRRLPEASTTPGI